ncbi:MAG: hypothetical protein ACXWIU_10535, partial [Limisphaerales bacterium]
NNTPEAIDDLNNLPVKTVNGATIYIRDVAHVRDGILPRLLQISVFSRACKCLTRIRVVSARSSELTSASLRNPGNIRLISSVQAASMDKREGREAAAAR